MKEYEHINLMQNLGAGISENDKHIFAQFVRAIINTEGTVLHTKENSLKNYVCAMNEFCVKQNLHRQEGCRLCIK